MKIKFHYGDGVINLPADLISVLPRADLDALRVLLCLAQAERAEIGREELARRCGCDAAAVDAAVAFWRGTGLIELDEVTVATSKTRKSRASAEQLETSSDQIQAKRKKDESEPTTDVVVKTSATALPAYTTEELASILERRRELTALVDECARVFGKIFNTHEVSQLIGLVDYLGLEEEYLLLLLAHCAKLGKKSLRYAVNTAVALYDDGITDTAALQQCLKARERRQEAEGQLRTMFGFGSRALTSKEKKMFDAWLTTHGFTIDVIRIAYEETINATGKPSVPYTNSILERWAAAGLKTAEQITQAQAAYKQQRANASTPGNSFDTNDFFDAALQRSFGEDYTPASSES
ncbi:MAG: DnaD domain protein [Clostridia bacterium]|nr:DnaD domain protein [Clostridia bacterium]